MATHIEMLVAQKMERGLDEPDARRQARLELGTIHAAREQVRERTGFALEQMWRELVQAARVLRRSPGLTVLSITTMGIGIMVSAILFALVNGIVLSPLPYPSADRLVRIFDTNHDGCRARGHRERQRRRLAPGLGHLRVSQATTRWGAR